MDAPFADLGVKTIRVKLIRLPGDFEALLKSPEVRVRQASIETWGLLQYPGVRKSDMTLVWGRKRVAAHILAGKDRIGVRLIDCSDDVKGILAEVENLERSMFAPHEASAATARLVQMVEAFELRKLQPGDPRNQKVLDRIHRSARALVATTRGIKPKSVEMAERRTKRRKEAEQIAQLEGPRPKYLPPPFKTWAPMEQQDIADAMEIMLLGQDAANKLSSAMGNMTKVLEAGLPVEDSQWRTLREDARRLAEKMRSLIPDTQCPYCKGRPELRPECAGCLGVGYATKGQRAGMPKDLLDDERRIVFVKGKVEPLERYLPPPSDDPWEGMLP